MITENPFRDPQIDGAFTTAWNKEHGAANGPVPSDEGPSASRKNDPWIKLKKWIAFLKKKWTACLKARSSEIAFMEFTDATRKEPSSCRLIRLNGEGELLAKYQIPPECVGVFLSQEQRLILMSQLTQDSDSTDDDDEPRNDPSDPDALLRAAGRKSQPFREVKGRTIFNVEGSYDPSIPVSNWYVAEDAERDSNCNMDWDDRANNAFSGRCIRNCAFII